MTHKKPPQPYPDFPLWPASNGRWAKQIRGKRYYFGAWADPDAALKLFERSRHELYAGRDPEIAPDCLTLEDKWRKTVASNAATTFSLDHSSARQRFRQAASHLGWQLESFPIGLVGPDGDELAFDVACSQGGDPEKVLVVSSGVHGVEGFFGSAVQVALLEQWTSAAPSPTRCVFLHGLNPFGFAWLRRFDENNVDPNRNFLLPGERFEGAPDGYAGLDDFLNPRRPPSRWEPFTLKALCLIAKQGMPALRQAIAAGQYDYPRGLFFGGNGPSRTQQLLEENMPRWLKSRAHPTQARAACSDGFFKA